MPKKHYKNGEKQWKKNLDHFLTLNLDHFLTLKPPNLGPLFNFTAYIYIYIYGHRPLCGPDFGQKSHFFPSFIVKMAKKKGE